MVVCSESVLIKPDDMVRPIAALISGLAWLAPVDRIHRGASFRAMAPAALGAVSRLLTMLPGRSVVPQSPVVDANAVEMAPPPQLAPVRSNMLPPSVASISQLEARAFLEAHDGDAALAEAALDAKAQWRKAQGRVTIAQVAPFYRSDGYSVVLEGLVDAEGDPLVFANGMPHGSPEEVVHQVMYTHERVMAQCEALGRPALRMTTIVNVRSPTFRFPDKACRAALNMQARSPAVTV